MRPLLIGEVFRTQGQTIQVQGYGVEQSFNPLLIGEVFRTGSTVYGANHVRYVSIPFSSGKSFGPGLMIIRWPMHHEFQSPSHRGSLSDEGKPYLFFLSYGCFNPLLIGEVFRTTTVHNVDIITAANVSIPFSSGKSFGRATPG